MTFCLLFILGGTLRKWHRKASRMFILTGFRLKNKYSAVAEIGDRLATIDMGRKLGGG